MILRSLLAFMAFSWAVFTLAADNEEPNGLNVEIFNDKAMTKVISRRIDPNIDWHWGAAKLVDGMVESEFNIRWTGWIKAPVKGQYEIATNGGNDRQIWIDDKLVIERLANNSVKKRVSIELTGEPQKFKMEYYKFSALESFATLRWRPVGSQVPVIIPTEAFFPTEETAKAKRPNRKFSPKNGLVAEYFSVNFTKRFGTGHVYRTEATWEHEPPFPGATKDAGVRYSGYLIPPKSGQYRIVAFADDLVRLSLSGKPLVEATHTKGTSVAYIELEAGKAYPIMIEYKNVESWGIIIFIGFCLAQRQSSVYLRSACIPISNRSLKAHFRHFQS